MHPKLADFWKASLTAAEFSREDLNALDFDAAVTELHSQLKSYNLFTESHIVQGLTEYLAQRVKYLDIDTLDLEINLRNALKTSFDQLDRRNLESDLLQEVPKSMLQPPTQPRRNSGSDDELADLSTDLVMRNAETIDRNDDELQQLQELDFGDDLSMDLGGGFDDEVDELAPQPELDFGSDLDYSSSPPHTPQHIEQEVEIGEHERPTKRARKTCVIDDETTLPARSAKVKLRSIPEFVPEPLSVTELGLGDREKWFDFNYIREHMRNLRASQGSQIENLEEEDGFEQEMDVDFNDYSFDSEVVDTEETLAETVALARQNLTDALSNNTEVSFNELALDGKLRACTLMEVLVKCRNHEITASQQSAWGDITINAC